MGRAIKGVFINVMMATPPWPLQKIENTIYSRKKTNTLQVGGPDPLAATDSIELIIRSISLQGSEGLPSLTFNNSPAVGLMELSLNYLRGCRTRAKMG